MKLVDITGQRFGMLTVIEKVYDRRRTPHTQWLCQCDCGNRVIVTGGNLRSGNTTSCGCKNNRSKVRWNYRRANADKNPTTQ